MKAMETTTPPTDHINFNCATVAILGRPNAGKSTLLNSLLESDLSATSERAQTTRTNIKGIVQMYDAKDDDRWCGQLVLVDTPGVNLRKGLLDRSMYTAIEEAMRDVDVGIWVADCRSLERDLDDIAMGRAGPEDRLALWLRDQIKKSGRTKWILAISKIDTRSKADLLPVMQKAAEVMPEFSEVIPLSAIQGLADERSNVRGLLNILEKMAPSGPPLYGEDDWTDLTGRELIRNLIRESIFRGSYKEVPYETDCMIESWVDPEEGQRMAEVHATICVSRDSLKAIMVGKGGSKIKEIGISVRNRYKDITGEEIILKLFVKVIEKWTLNPSRLKDLGYENT